MAKLSNNSHYTAFPDASDGNLTMHSQFLNVSQSSDKLKSQKLSAVVTVRKTK